MSKSETVDVVIAGGGLVGLSLALAMARQGRDVTLIESFAFRSGTQPHFDDRTLALSLASTRILDALGAWTAIAASATPIERVRVSMQRRFGGVRLDADELGLDAFGHVALARVVGQSLLERAQNSDRIQIIAPARLESFERDADGVAVTVVADSEARSLRARILVGADGADSMVRKALRLDTVSRDYQQIAMIANASTTRPHGGCAIEHLTPDGPVALLPHGPDRVGSVWCVAAEDAARWLDADDETYRRGLEQAVGRRLGAITRVGKRSSYPLGLTWTRETVVGRCVVLGNAAHAIHPIGAQGFNLGLRDVAALSDALGETDLADASVVDALLAYQSGRLADQEGTVQFTDSLISWLGVDNAITGIGAGLAMHALDRIGPLRRAVTRRAMGFRGAPSTWAGDPP